MTKNISDSSNTHTAPQVMTKNISDSSNTQGINIEEYHQTPSERDSEEAERARHYQEWTRQKNELQEVEINLCHPLNLSVSINTFLTPSDHLLDMDLYPTHVVLPRCPQCVGFCSNNSDICLPNNYPFPTTTIYIIAWNLKTNKPENHQRQAEYHKSCECSKENE
ncbi:hypothetical protein Pmani_015707 [Petrolisthes manimaculis]|uniref:Platelet-derived growth factor (PDGF) family profile domain-containing protein n=1 Tax=Petrolisthes manimaculis TaxID=1843537 RepID=A0AAE1PTW0_9EUCA|nr:hypothetical protein Pmani_015707 [Petrolisthes manimaculis]